MKTRIAIGLILSLAAAAALARTDAADFSGRWKLNLSKSSTQEIYPEVVPEMTLDIKLAGASLTVRKTIMTAEGGKTTEQSWTTDGKECVTAGKSIKDLKSACRLVDGRLFIKGEREGALATAMAGGGAENVEYFRYSFEETYSLSADGRVMTVVQTLNYSGSKTITLVFDRV